MNNTEQAKKSLKKPVRRSTRKMVGDNNPPEKLLHRSKTAGSDNLIIRPLKKK